jgi:hypothetical protein
MLRYATFRYSMKRSALIIKGSRYLTAASLIESLGISRQTLWRWRAERSVPMGSKYQDRVLVFTEEDAELVRQFASRVVPAIPPESPQRRRSKT